MSIILGTVAFSYGSVPMYKMVSLLPAPNSHSPWSIPNIRSIPDLPNHRLGWPTHQIPRSRQHLRSLKPRPARHRPQTNPHHLQRFGLRRAALEIHTPAARSSSTPWRDGFGILYRDEQIERGYYWGSYL